MESRKGRFKLEGRVVFLKFAPYLSKMRQITLTFLRIAASLVFWTWVSLHSGMAQVAPSPKPVAQDTPATTNQPKTDIHIQSTDLLHFAKFGKDSVQIRKLIGNVELRQDSTFIYCDSALQFIDTNLVLARGHVIIQMSGNRTIYADELDYTGDTKILILNKNVKMTDSAVTLYTQKLTYYREQSYGEYTTGGRVVSKENTLTSKKGYYYPDNDMAYFKEDVVLVNPDYRLETDTLGYNTDTRIAFFLAPTKVKDSLNDMYTEDGYYDTENDFAFLHTNAHIGDSTYTLFADTIQYDQRNDLGKAIGHVIAEQKDSTLTVFGKYAEFHSKTERVFVTDSTFAVQMTDQDTLYLLADTLYTYTDTLTDKRFFSAYHGTTLFMNDLQGVCDSLAYWYDDSLMFMFRDPFLWSAESQLNGDTIIMGMKNGGIDTLSIPSNPMIASKEDTVGFSQIKGKQLTAKFEDKEIRRMHVLGNSESVYFTKDDGSSYLGMNTAKCSNMQVDFVNSKPSKILFEIQPEGTFYPMHLVPDDKRTLEGFRWNSDARPVRPQWAYDRLQNLYGPVDTLMRTFDSIQDRLSILESTLERLMTPEMPSAEGPGSDTLSGQSSVDTLVAPVIPVDSLIETMDVRGPGKGGLKPGGSDSLAVVTPEDSAAGKAPRPQGKFVSRVKLFFAPLEEREAAARAREIERIRKKADRYERRRLAKNAKRKAKAG